MLGQYGSCLQKAVGQCNGNPASIERVGAFTREYRLRLHTPRAVCRSGAVGRPYPGPRWQQDGQTVVTQIAPRPANLVDPTGAGDIFTLAFIIRYQETGDPVESARFADVTASFGIGAVGVAGIPSRQQMPDYMTTHPWKP